jgi:hypothetical protein
MKHKLTFLETYNKEKEDFKKTIIFDFDDTMHEMPKYPEVGPPIAKTKKLIKKLLENEWKVVVYSTRCSDEEGIKIVKKFVRDNYSDLGEVTVVDKKIPAMISIDDRAINFHPNISYDTIASFVNWKEDKIKYDEFQKNYINDLSKDLVSIDSVSDGYHTFEELYVQRTVLLSLAINSLTLLKMNGHISDLLILKSLFHEDGTNFGDTTFLLAVAFVYEGEAKQFSFHCMKNTWDLFTVPAYVNSIIKYDGHTPQSAISNIETLTNMLGDMIRHQAEKNQASASIKWGVFGDGSEVVMPEVKNVEEDENVKPELEEEAETDSTDEDVEDTEEIEND